MPKKQKAESQADQSDRFKREAQKLIDVGELNPIEAERAIEKILDQGRLVRKVGE